MWNNPVLATALVVGLVAFGPLAAPALAQKPLNTRPVYTSPPYYYGYNPSSVTPFRPGSYGGGLYVTSFVPLVVANIPSNNQIVPIYSGSFCYFGMPNGLSLCYYGCCSPWFAMPYIAPVYSFWGYHWNYVPPAYAFGGYNPSSVTPFK